MCMIGSPVRNHDARPWVNKTEMKKTCMFCEIAKGNVPARIIHHDKHVVAFLPKDMNVKGHTLVAPVRHWDTLFAMPKQDAARLMHGIKQLAALLKSRLGADGINILHASGQVAQQSVMHVHFHLIPRYRNDGLDAWPPLPEWQGDVEKLLHQLRSKKTKGHPTKRCTAAVQ